MNRKEYRRHKKELISKRINIRFAKFIKRRNDRNRFDRLCNRWSGLLVPGNTLYNFYLRHHKKNEGKEWTRNSYYTWDRCWCCDRRGCNCRNISVLEKEVDDLNTYLKGEFLQKYYYNPDDWYYHDYLCTWYEAIGFEEEPTCFVDQPERLTVTIGELINR